MSNIVQPSYEINYISQQKRILVGRNNNPLSQKFKIDNRIRDTYYFQVVSRNNQIVNLSGFSYQFYGSYIDAKNNQHVLFYSDDFDIEDNVLSFKVNTYNSQYLTFVKTQKQIELTIKKKDEYIDQVILRDTGLAYPTPRYDGDEPSEVVAGFGLQKNGYVLSLTGTVLSGGTDIQIVDNIINYTGQGGGATYTAASGIGITDQNVIYLSATIPTVPTDISAFDNDAGYVTSTYVTEAISGKANINDVWTKEESYSYIEVNAISTALSSAVSGAGYLTSVPDTYALKTDIPTDVATSSYVQSASGNAVTVATGWVNSQNYLTSVPDTYALKTDIPTDYTTSAQVSAIASAYAGSATGDVTSAQVSAIVEGYNYITGITVSYNDEEWTEYTLSGKGISFTDDIYFEAGENNDIIDVIWKGIRFVGGSESIDQYSKRIDWSNDFTVEDDEGDVYISLATPIPLSTSQLINDSDYQTAAQVSAIASAYGGGGGGINATKLSQLQNDVGFVTIDDVSRRDKTNKQSVDTPVSNTITYNSTIDIFKTTYEVSNDAITLNTVTVPAGALSAGEIATFEEWIYTANSFSTVNFGSNVLIGEVPSTFLAATNHVFVRRLINNNGTIEQYISFAYEFPTA